MSDLTITVWQPFAGLLVSGVKTVENRTWSPRGLRPGDRFLIHAGVRYDRDSWEWVLGLAEELKAKNQWRMFRTPSWPLSASKPNPDADPVGATPYGAIVGAVTLDEVRRAARGDDPWFCGPIGWYVRDPVPIDPVWCSGAQGLWKPSPAVIAEVNARVETVLAAERERDNRSLREANIRCFTCGAQVVSHGLNEKGCVMLRCSEKNCDVIVKGMERR